MSKLIDNFISNEELTELYKNGNKLLDKYHNNIITNDIPYIDEALKIYNEKKEALILKRNQKHYENLEHALNDLHLSCYQTKKQKLIERLRNKLNKKKCFFLNTEAK